MQSDNTRIVDVRQIPGPQRHPTILNTFASLIPGESMTLVTDHDPRPLFHQFDTQMPDQFRWTYVEQGPAVWRVEIVKRHRPASPEDPEALRTLRQQHKELEKQLVTTRLWLPVLQSEGAAIIPKISGRLAAFDKLIDEELSRHIATEEQALHPVLARHFDDQTNPLVLLQNQRRLLETQAAQFREGVRSRDPEMILGATAGILGVMLDHVKQEENSLLPMALETLSAEEWLEVLNRLRDPSA